MKRLGTVLMIAVVLFAGLSPRATAVQTHKIFVNGLWLSYLDRGRGAPIVLVPGTMSDFRIWMNQVEPFAQRGRVLAYSRRYNWPNSAPGTGADGSMRRQVEDLAALIKGMASPLLTSSATRMGGTSRCPWPWYWRTPM